MVNIDLSLTSNSGTISWLTFAIRWLDWMLIVGCFSRPGNTDRLGTFHEIALVRISFHIVKSGTSAPTLNRKRQQRLAL